MPERNTVYFVQPQHVEVRQGHLPDPGPGQALVRTLYSAISPGTEMLFYRGQFPTELPLDDHLSALTSEAAYPLSYGYAAVGQIEGVGGGVATDLVGRLVFAFQPHSCHFICAAQELQLIPPGIQPRDALFLPNMETAVNFMLDGAPLIGEGVAVFGQGIVGLLTTALLARFPLSTLVTFDLHPLRREASQALKIDVCLDPAAPDDWEQARRLFPQGADLVYEISGAPAALDAALELTGFAGRVVIGSWYGAKPVQLNLGGTFHRSRIRLLSSQVSSLAPGLRGRWNSARRFDVAWEMIRQVRPSRWITHTFALADAPRAYQLIDQNPEKTIQVIFEYQSMR